MKLSKTFKRFWNMQKHTGGFTLVELIVVIAILAILAGVAIPAYSGYITKANEAADRQLLSAINRAFTAACNSNGFSQYDVKTAEISVDAEGKIVSNARAAVNYIANAKKQDGTDVTEKLNESFAVFFAGNENAAFKTVKGKKLPFANGAFGLPGEGGEIKVTLGGVDFYISQEAANKLKDSTFGTIGAAGLLDKVDTVTGLAAELAAMDGSYVGQALANSMLGLAEDLNIDISTPEGEAEFGAAMEQLIADKMALNGDDDWNKARSEVLANYAVLQAAKTQSASGKTTEELLGELQAGIGADDIKSLLKGQDTQTTQDGINKTAMMYAMYTAYANQLPEGEEKNAALEATKTPGAFVNHMDDDGFVAYLNGETGNAAADLEGYLGALDIINQSAASSSDATMDLLVGGYKDPELEQALAGILGNP